MTNFDGVERVIDHPKVFKSKLGIGADAFASLRKKKLVGEGVRILDTAGAFGVGAAVASSSAVAATFFAPTGLLAALGIGAAAATPIGWVIAAGVASTAGYYGISRYLRSGREDRVDVVPKWINTPLDALAVVMFDFFALLGLNAAHADGLVTDSERQCIENYFVSEWGYSPEFVRKALPDAECNLESLRVVELVNNMIEYQIGNPDCNYDALSRELTSFLKEVTRADGELHDQEVIFVQWLEITLARGKPGFWDELYSSVGFGRRSGKKTQGEGESTQNPAFDGNAPNSSREQAEKVEIENSGNGDTHDSTLVGRNIRRVVHWAQDGLRSKRS